MSKGARIALGIAMMILGFLIAFVRCDFVVQIVPL